MGGVCPADPIALGCKVNAGPIPFSLTTQVSKKRVAGIPPLSGQDEKREDQRKGPEWTEVIKRTRKAREKAKS